MNEYTQRRLPWRRRLICVPAVLLLFVFSAQAQTDAILPPIGGGGGSQFVARCAPSQLLTGVELRTGDDVDAIWSLCVTAYGPTNTGPIEGYQPSQAGANLQLVCPRNAPIVTGMYVKYEGEDTTIVNNIHLFCGVAATSQMPSEFPSAMFDGPAARAGTNIFGGGGGFTSQGSYTQYCPTGLVAVGINGRSGIWLDAVGLICGPPTLTARAPEPEYKALGRVKLSPTGAPPRSLCDAARSARARNSLAAPGLEAQCRAAGETPPPKALGRVKLSSPPTVQVGPTMTADTNPVMVPVGQASGTTTITWNAAPDYTYSEIYLSVDNGQWSEFARGRNGTKPTTIKPGGSHTFRMMVYEGQAGTPNILTTLTVTAAQGNPDPPICTNARSARARNSPAAPGLEAQCRAQGGTL